MFDASGKVQAEYDYDPSGRMTLVLGTNLSDFQYADYYTHQPSGLNLTMYRAYDPNTARWLSRDPIAEQGGLNLYGYVGNDPIDGFDPLGLLTYFTYYTGLDDSYRTTGIQGSIVVGLGALGVATFGLADVGAIALAARFPWLVSAAIRGAQIIDEANGQGGTSPCSTAAETIEPAAVRFSQSSIKSVFKNRGSIDDLAAGLKNG